MTSSPKAGSGGARVKSSHLALKPLRDDPGYQSWWTRTRREERVKGRLQWEGCLWSRGSWDAQQRWWTELIGSGHSGRWNQTSSRAMWSFQLRASLEGLSKPTACYLLFHPALLLQVSALEVSSSDLSRHPPCHVHPRPLDTQPGWGQVLSTVLLFLSADSWLSPTLDGSSADTLGDVQVCRDSLGRGLF